MHQHRPNIKKNNQRATNQAALTLLFTILTLISADTQAQTKPAQDLSSQDKEALQQTQEFLKNSKERSQYVNQNKDAKKADDMVTQLFGGDAAASEEVYALAAEVMANVVKDANGDVDKMQAAMKKFATDPSSFAASWTPEQKAKLSKLAEKVKRPDLKPK